MEVKKGMTKGKEGEEKGKEEVMGRKEGDVK